jgi:hypothetical protein
LGFHTKLADNEGKHLRNLTLREELHGHGRLDPKVPNLLKYKVADSTWQEFQHYAPMACDFAYQPAAEMQRQINLYTPPEHRDEPYVLLLAETEQSLDRPGFFLVAHRTMKRLVLAIRGSQNPYDWLINFKFETELLLVKNSKGELKCIGRVHAGLQRRVRTLQQMLESVLDEFEEEEYTLVVTGKVPSKWMHRVRLISLTPYSDFLL